MAAPTQFPHNMPAHSSDYGTATFDIFDDVPECLYFAFCGPCAALKLFSMTAGRKCSPLECCCCCGGVNGCTMYLNRLNLRAKFGFPQDECNDCLCFCMCGSCSACRDAREVKNRYRQVGIEWNLIGNEMMQNPGAAAAAPEQAAMSYN